MSSVQRWPGDSAFDDETAVAGIDATVAAAGIVFAVASGREQLGGDSGCANRLG